MLFVTGKGRRWAKKALGQSEGSALCADVWFGDDVSFQLFFSFQLYPANPIAWMRRCFFLRYRHCFFLIREVQDPFIRFIPHVA